jgi:Arc/MetJ-type ribon-helix-helix transcriptional regulator
LDKRLTVRLPEHLAEKLERVARSHRKTRSHVVRLALERFVETAGSLGCGRPVDKVRDLLGSFESGVPDLGQRHREHLLARLRRGSQDRGCSRIRP